jgi:hypothetical protein
MKGGVPSWYVLEAQRFHATEIPCGGRYAMQTHIGVDLHQRFCYLTALDASGRRLKQSQVVNEAAAL